MIIPQRLPDGKSYAIVCPSCGAAYSVVTGKVQPDDPAAPANLQCTPLPKGSTTLSFVNEKRKVGFDCPQCHAQQSIVA